MHYANHVLSGWDVNKRHKNFYIMTYLYSCSKLNQQKENKKVILNG